LLLALLAISGCHPSTAGDLDRQLVAEVITGSEIAGNLRVLCMPGGRLSGSPNGAQAEQWVADKLHQYGLSNVHFEPFDMTTWCDRKTEVTVLGDDAEELQFVQALGNCLSTPPQGIVGELVDVGLGAAEDFQAKADQLQGKFVLAHDSHEHRSTKMYLALQHGALGLLLASGLDDQVVVGVCHDAPQPQPGIAICKKDGDMLAERLAAGRNVRINVKIEADAWECRPRNVVGELPGRGLSSDQVILLCGHLDSWHLAEGALDNATGSATLLEVARVLSKLHPRPSRTVRFVWFMGEEHGLIGSKRYVEEHQGELDRIVAVVNLDMIGEPRRLVSYGHPEVLGLLKEVEAAVPAYELEEGLTEPSGWGSDHGPFVRQGICCLTLNGDMGPGVKYYHTPFDKYEQVDRRGLSAAAAVLAVLGHHLADSPGMPARRLPATSETASRPSDK
jgi:hypothetical protein